MRGLHQESGGRFSFIIAGVNPFLCEESYINNVQNPIFQLVQPKYLAPLDENSVRMMMRRIGKYMGVKFDGPLYKYLGDEFGGHPFLIRLACSEILKQMDRRQDGGGIILKISDFNSKKLISLLSSDGILAFILIGEGDDRK